MEGSQKTTIILIVIVLLLGCCCCCSISSAGGFWWYSTNNSGSTDNNNNNNTNVNNTNNTPNKNSNNNNSSSASAAQRYVLYPNTDVSGFDLASMPIPSTTSADACATKCAENNECSFFVYNTQNQNCWLKKPVPLNTATTLFTTPAGEATLSGLDIWGSDMQGMPVTNQTLQSCQAEMKNRGGQFASFINDGKCYVKKGTTDSSAVLGLYKR